MNTTFSTADVNPAVEGDSFPNGATASLYIFQMSSATDASGLYSALLTANLYAKYTNWTDPSSPLVGTHSRIVDTGDHWWINFYKDNYYVEVSIGPSFAADSNFTPGDAATKAAAFTFASAIAAKL